MPDKEPVLLVVFVETQVLRWYVAGVDLEGNAFPLLRSADGNLSPYVGKPGDEQLSFLRHRFSGVLQRGCDRLWGRRMKPVHIVFVADQLFPHADAELTQQIADHLVEWMWNPPVTFCVGADAATRTAGELPSEMETALHQGLPKILAQMENSDEWELAAEMKKNT